MLTGRLPVTVYSAAEIRRHEPEAAADSGLSMYTLMDRAGSALAEQLQAMAPEPGRLLVLAGKGNNGGDGYVLARLAQQAGWQALVAQVGGVAPAEGDAGRAASAWHDAAGRTVSTDSLRDEDWQADVTADGLLGTGLSGQLREPFISLIRKINHSPSRVLAIDIPSGLHADTGQPLGAAVRADATVTFVGLKPGLLTGRAADFVGQLRFASLGIGQALARRVTSSVGRCDYAGLSHWLQPRARCSHKGSHGRVLLLGGARHMPGALRLAGEACLRAGAGLVKLAAHPCHGAELLAGRPELMLAGLDETSEQQLAAGVATELAWADVLVLGPGMGRDKWAEQRFNTVLEALNGANPVSGVLLDADALYWLARTTDPEQLPGLSQTVAPVFTPHSGEAARLLGISAAEVEADRLATARHLVSRFGGVWVLKGPGSVIADGARLWLAGAGNPGMASGGMGDVLSGIIAALLAQGLPPFEAAALGVELHCQAAGRAAVQGERGLLAHDLMPHIRKLVNPSHVATCTR